MLKVPQNFQRKKGVVTHNYYQNTIFLSFKVFLTVTGYSQDSKVRKETIIIPLYPLTNIQAFSSCFACEMTTM